MSVHPRSVQVFAYGSLLYEPECPEDLLAVRPARLPGWRRSFNKRSWARGCRAAEVRWPELSAPADFCRADFRQSLVLGTEPDPAGALDGGVLVYPAEVTEPLLARLDRREGYDPDDRPGSGYHRTWVEVEHLGDGRRDRAITYLTHREGPAYAGDLTPEEIARVLLCATPSQAERALGVEYLHGVCRALATFERRDPYLDELVDAARRVLGA